MSRRDYWANHLDLDFGFGLSLSEDVGPHWGWAGVDGVLGGFSAATLRCESPPVGDLLECPPEANNRLRYVVSLFFPNDNGVTRRHGPLELYLMGLIPISQAPTSIIKLLDAESLYDTYDEATNTLVVEASGATTVELSDIVERHGTVVELPESARAFKAAFVVISAEPATDEVLGEVAQYAAIHGNRASDPDILSFEELTGARATLDTRLGRRRSMSDPAPPPPRAREGCSIDDQDCGAGRACFFGGSKGFCGLSRGGMKDSPCTARFDCAPGLDCSPSMTTDGSACEP